MLEQFIDPLWWHHQVPLLILEVLLPLISHLSCLFYHALNFVWMERIENLEEEISLRRFTIKIGEVISDVRPIIDLSQDILDSEPRPVRNSLSWHLLLT